MSNRDKEVELFIDDRPIDLSSLDNYSDEEFNAKLAEIEERHRKIKEEIKSEKD